MPRYLVQATYTPEAWAAMLKNPQDRNEIVAPLQERLGGRFESAYLAFGDHDVVAIAELPDNVSAAALSMITSAGGAVKAVKTTPLGPRGDAQGGRGRRELSPADRLAAPPDGWRLGRRAPGQACD